MFSRFKILTAFSFAMLLALILGFLAASPGETTFMLIGMLILALPLFFAWHHALLIIFWNSALTAYFLPGHPNLWLVFAALSFGLSVLNHVMGRRLLSAGSGDNAAAYFFIGGGAGHGMVQRGGIGFEAMGAAVRGGKFYIYIFLAIFGYFALTGSQIPLAKARRMVSLYFLSWDHLYPMQHCLRSSAGLFLLSCFLPAVAPPARRPVITVWSAVIASRGSLRPARRSFAFCWGFTASRVSAL